MNRKNAKEISSWIVAQLETTAEAELFLVGYPVVLSYPPLTNIKFIVVREDSISVGIVLIWHKSVFPWSPRYSLELESQRCCEPERLRDLIKRLSVFNSLHISKKRVPYDVQIDEDIPWVFSTLDENELFISSRKMLKSAACIDLCLTVNSAINSLLNFDNTP
ncbi:hypothetical protein [Calycomorphotria hydatis]|uniref:Uncharacterized protein n=1 Tax=Calycomorphotria hydatis TaxID=2528027 RepID=A0A517TF48_9PLAN|nr:hypothetical protein [Calycomorphotria hydatis]QDT66988.1 hypothetical protein V22_42600 [Calycomorphotria hydatis]